MALGIRKGKVTTIWEIPLVQGDGTSNDWKDNTWIVEHLRQLADKIEEDNPSLYSISLNTGVQHGPMLQLELFERL